MLENRLAIASVSLGQHASHTLPDKIAAAAESGILGIEITYPDLEYFSSCHSISMLEGARKIRQISGDFGVTVLAFASFQNFEGNPSPLRGRLELAEKWLTIARALGAEHLQIPSYYLHDINNNHSVIVSELRQLAELAGSSTPIIKVAYENLAWSSHCTLWQEALQIVQEVDRPNFGLCLDSFHLSTKLWADPYSPDSRLTGGDKLLQESLDAFVRDCPVDKIFYIQLSDGEPMDPPYSKSHPWYDASLEPGHVWSNEARPFPLETEYGAFMPVQAITEAFLVGKGFKGWVSLETFDRRMREESQGPKKNAQRAARSWCRLREAILANSKRSHL